MADTKPDSRQIKKRSALPRLGTAANATVEAILDKVNVDANYPLRLAASDTPDARLNFSSSSVVSADSANEIVSPVKKQIFPSLSSPWINFQTQAVSNAADFDIVFPVTNTVGRFRQAGFTLISSGKIKVLFSDEALTEGALPNAGALFVSGGLPIGYVVLECTNTSGYFKTAGSASSIIENAKIFRFGSGAGGGSGTGDANTFTENLKHRLTSSYYEFVTPVVFESDEQTRTASATATFDIVDGVYRFNNAAENFVSIQMFDTEFLANDDDSRQVELHAEWFDSASRDDSATYQVALDGTNYETVTMTRQGLSQKFTGSKLLAVPSSVVVLSQASTDTNTELDASSLQALSAPFTLSAKNAISQLAIEIDELGTPVGSYIVSICKDNSGVPGDVIFSKIALVSTLNSGLNVITLNSFRNVLVAGNYHIKIETDATYKAGFSAGVNSIRLKTNSGGNDLVYNGTTWSAGTVDLKYALSGHAYDLRVQVASSAGSKKLKAFGIFYDEQVGDAIDGIDATQTFIFSGDLNTTTFLVTNFLPTQEKLKVYDIKTGQVYRYPAFQINGNTITFDSGTFLVPGETVQLIFDQSEGAAIASSVVVTGTGGGAGDLDTLLSQTFDSSALGDFTQTGLELITTNPLNGTQSARLVHQAASNRSFKQTVAIAPKFRGVNMTASVAIRSSASQGNVTIAFRDETNGVDYPSQQLQTNSQAIASLVTNSTITVSGFSNSSINTLKVGMTVTGSGIQTGTRIATINTTALTITLSQAATASATVSLRFSDLPRTLQLGFNIPANCSSYSYTISALQESGSPETYIDDVVLKNYWLGMSNQGQSTLSVPSITQQSQYLEQSGSVGVATVTGAATSTVGTDIFSYNSGTGLYTVLKDANFTLNLLMRSASAVKIEPIIVVNGVDTIYSSSDTAAGNSFANCTYSQTLPVGATFSFRNSVGTTDVRRISISADAVTTSQITTNDLVPAKAVLGNSTIDIPNMTAWQGYTPAFQGFGTPSAVEFEWRQVGENVEIRGKFTAGVVTTAEARVGLPVGLTSAGTSIIPSLTLAGDHVRNNQGSTYFRGSILIEPSVSYITFGAQSSTQNALTKVIGTNLVNNSDTVSLTASIPCAGLSATEQIVVSGTQSALVEEGDSNLEMSDSSSIAANAIYTFSTVTRSIGDAIRYENATGRFYATKNGTFSASMWVTPASVSGVLPQLYRVVNGATSLMSRQLGVASTGGMTHVSSSFYLNSGDYFYFSNDNSGGAGTVRQMGVTYQGSLKVLNTSADQKITIPTSELRFEGASARGTGTETAIVQFTSMTKIRGDAFTVDNSNGTAITMTKAGKLDVSSSLRNSNGSCRISRNQAIRTALPTSSETLAGESGVALDSTIAWSGFVSAGDVIRICADNTPTSAVANNLNLAFQEQDISVSVTNTLPQFSESDSSVRVDTANGYGSTATKIRRFSNIRDNVGTDIEYTDSAANGASFTAMSSGIYMISYSEQTTLNTTPRIGISKNASSLINNIDDISANERLAISSDEGGSSASKYMSVSWQGYLQSGDIIRPHSSGQTNTVPGGVTFTISKVGKPNVTGVDVTPFVNVSQPEQGATVRNYTSLLASNVFNFNTVVEDKNINKFLSYDPTTGKWTALKRVTIDVSFFVMTINGVSISIDKNDSSLAISDSGGAAVGGYHRANGSAKTILEAGETIRLRALAAPSTIYSTNYFSIEATALSDQILTAPETFSTDTAALQYASSTQYTLSTLANAPVGTFITFVHSANSNTRTQTTANPPSQSTSDMNANGIILTTRAYNAGSSSATPSAFAIQIGKGLKGLSLNLYKSSAKTGSGSLDGIQYASTTFIGAAVKSYNENTGILYIDTGYQTSTTTSANFVFDDLTTATSGYLVINASKNVSLTGMNIERVAARGINTAGTVMNATGVTMPVTVVFDTHGALNTNGTFTAPETGYYQISASMYYSNATYAVGQAVYIQGFKNGVLYSTSMVFRVGAATTTFMGAGPYSDLVFLGRGETFQVRGVNERGATALDTGTTVNFFSIAKVNIGKQQ